MSDDLADNLKYAQFLEYAFPSDEMEAATVVSILLNQMTMHVLVDFNAALDLYDHCERCYIEAVARGDRFNANGFARQSYVPARDGAMTIYHFGETLADIKGRVGLIPNMRRRVFTDELKLAQQQFKSHFPSYTALRHGVAHISIALGKITIADLNSPTLPFPNVRDRRFRTVWEKREVSYSLSLETREHLLRAASLVLHAFRKVYYDCEEAFIAGRKLESGT
jgi:hypothetical protein